MLKKHAAYFLMAALIFTIPALTSASEWKLDKAHSHVKFKVKHLMVANVWGEFQSFETDIQYDHPELSTAKVEVTVDVASIDTGNDKRDDHLRSEDFFHVSEYPEMTFTSTSITKQGDELVMVGDLTIKGITHEVTLRGEGPQGPVDFMGTQRFAASLQGTLDRTAFGLTWNKALETGGVVVGEEVELIIDAEVLKEQ